MTRRHYSKWPQDRQKRFAAVWTDSSIELSLIVERFGMNDGALRAQAKRQGLPPRVEVPRKNGKAA